MRVRLLLAYDGSGYHGFAEQDDVVTVAGDLREALEKLLNHQVEITCAGRTDTGVHAWGQVVHFDTDRAKEKLAGVGSHDSPNLVEVEQLAGLRHSLNKLLAPAIVIRGAQQVPDEFHARFSATARTYRYTILNSEIANPFVAKTSWHVESVLDVNAMRIASDALLGEHDFASFCKKPGSPDKTTKRRILSAEWSELADNVLQFEVKANAFCHQQVRSMVGTLVDMGMGRLKAGEMSYILRAKDRQFAGQVAPPQGLCLWHVDY